MNTSNKTKPSSQISKRFRGFLPVVIDVETGGFNPKTDALLEIAASIIHMDDSGLLHPGEIMAYHILPFQGANLESTALEFNKIDPYHPFRFAVEEKVALENLLTVIKNEMHTHRCHRAVLVGHNPFFDLSFLQAAVKRCQIKDNPFHAFTTLDTATLSALAYGHTVLAKAMKLANIPFDQNEAHSALYDTRATAALFCQICNRWKELGG